MNMSMVDLIRSYLNSVWVFLLVSSEAVKSQRTNPSFVLGPYRIPTWITPILAIVLISFLLPQTNLIGNLCGASVGYLWGLNYIKFIAPPERVLLYVEDKLNLLGRLPHFISTDRRTYGRYGVLDAADDRSLSLP